MFGRSRVTVAVTALAAAGAMVLTGCGSSGGGTAAGNNTNAATSPTTAAGAPTTAAQAPTSAAAAPTGASSGTSTGATGTSPASLVPAAVKTKGVLTIASDASYPPMEFFKPGTTTPVIGADADLAAAIGKVLGLKTTVKNATFATIIPGLVDGKYNLGMSSFTINATREKKVDFVSYFNAGMSFYIPANSTKSFNGVASLCGAKVAVENGTTEQSAAKAESPKCTAAGKKAVTVLQFGTQSEANVAVSSGRADVGFADSPPVAYIVQQSHGKFKNTGKPFGVAPYGIAMAKNSGLAKAVQAAMQELIGNGTYASILKKWGLTAGAITASTIQPPQS